MCKTVTKECICVTQEAKLEDNWAFFTVLVHVSLAFLLVSANTPTV